MTVKRLIIFMLLPIIMMMLWSIPTFAGDQKVVIPEGGECKIDDDYKKHIGVQACLALAKVHNRYMKYVEFLQKEYEGGGVCHHLYNPKNHNGLVSLTGSLLDELPISISSLSFLHGLEDAKELEWTENDRAGAKAIDEDEQFAAVRGGAAYKALTSAGTNCVGVLKKVETDPWKDYTDYHIQKMVNSAKEVLDIATTRFKEAQAEGKATSQMLSEIQKYEECYQKAMIAEKYRNDGSDGFIQNRKIAENYLSVLGGAETMCTCEKDSEGKPTDKVDFKEGCMSLQETVEDNLSQECKTIAQYQAEMGDICLTCGLMAKILAAAQKISGGAFAVIAGDLINLLGVALLIFIAYTVLLTVASPGQQKISKLLTSVLIQGAKVAFAILLLKNGEYVYQNALNPIIDGGVDFGLAFTNISSDGGENVSSSKEMNITLSEMIKDAGVAEIAKSGTEFQAPDKYLSTSTLEKLVGANRNFSQEAAIVPAVGRSFICNSMRNLGLANLWVFPRLKMFLTGVILLVFGVMMWVAVGFYLLDCCIQLGLVAAMVPFFIACWPFKMTNSYLRVGWNMFLNTFFNFVMMSVVIVTIVLLITGCLPDNLTQDMNEDNLDAINDQLELIGLQIIKLVVICMLCLKLSKEAGRLANKLAGGAQIRMGGELGGLASDVATKAVTSSAKAGGKTVSNVASSAAEASGLKAWGSSKKQSIKNRLGGATKSKGASFKQIGTTNKDGEGGDKDDGGNKGGSDDKGDDNNGA